MIDPQRIFPHAHRLFVELTPVLPPGEFSIGHYMPTVLFYHPLEVPGYIRKRLLAFLRGKMSVPDACVEPLLPAAYAETARREFHTLLAAGLDEGEALISMGILAKPRPPSAPQLSVARIIRSACDCVKEEYVLVESSAGEPVGERTRLIRCGEALAATEARTAASVKAEEAACEARRRAAFLRARRAS